MTNQEIAQEINNRIGNSPVPFDSVYSIALEIYQELGGEESQFDSVYSILLETLNVIDSGISAKVIDDSSISLSKTWSSSKISSELADAGFKTQFVNELPATGDIHTIYFVPSGSAQTGNVYDEYMWNASASEWEQVGSTAIDLTDIINDASVLSNRTWSSEKINSELEALAGDAIEDVSVLPDASENKSKLIRLTSDDNVYVSELKSRTTTTTNRLPDEQQIDKAYLYDTDNVCASYYKGKYHIICSDGETDGYAWLEVEENYTNLIITLKDAVNITNNDTYGGYFDVDSEATFDETTRTITIENYNLANLSDNNLGEEIYVIPAIYNAPESAQIGNAYMNDGQTRYYTGIQKTIVCSDGSLNLYQWGDNNDEYIYFTEKPASDLYLFSDAEVLGVIYTDFNVAYVTLEDGWEVSGNTYTNLNMSTEDIWDTVDSYGINPIYIPQLNAPDSEQVGNAYLVTSDYNGDDTTFKYTGEQVTLIGTNGSFTGYKWKATVAYAANEIFIFSTLNANSIYCDINNSTENIWYCVLYDEYDSNNNVWGEGTVFTSNSDSISFYPSSEFFDVIENPELSIVKYQRTEVTEEWDWLPLTDNATNDDIDLMFDTPAPESPVVKRVLMKANDRGFDMTIKEGFVNVNDETMEYEGQTYYKWIKYEEQDNGESIPDEIQGDDDEYIAVLTTSLNPSLPFNTSSPEWAYTIGIFTDGTGYQDEVYNTEEDEEFPVEALIHEDGSITYEE